MASFTGPDYFTFKASNGITESEPAEVSIQVNPWSGDTTPPEVSWTDPQDDGVVTEISTTPVYTDAVGPAYAPFLLVQFSEGISATTLTTETVQVFDDGAQPISITVLYDEMLARTVIIPRQPLQDDTRYEATVSQGVKDLMGNPMAADYTWHFDVGTVVEPVAGLSATNDSPTQLGDATTFTATVTAGDDVAYAWGFGDGHTASGAVVTHTYSEAKLYTATVTATNSINILTKTTLVSITTSHHYVYLPLVLTETDAEPTLEKTTAPAATAFVLPIGLLAIGSSGLVLIRRPRR
jgi:hypothetical protein